MHMFGHKAMFSSTINKENKPASNNRHLPHSLQKNMLKPHKEITRGTHKSFKWLRRGEIENTINTSPVTVWRDVYKTYTYIPEEHKYFDSI